MRKSNKKKFNKLPKKLLFKEFKLYFLPHLFLPKAGIIIPPKKLHAIFNYRPLTE